jgi:hypothetical protein
MRPLPRTVQALAAVYFYCCCSPRTTVVAATQQVSVSFATPVLVGSSNASAPNGSNFWFPSITSPTGIKGHVAQHITLSGDGGTCPPPKPLGQYCEQIMLSHDGGRTYTVTKKLGAGTSGNFNGYGDLGTWVPPPQRRTESTPGKFQTIVGCNDCEDAGGSLMEPAFLQTWMDDGGTLKLMENISITYKHVPPSFTAKMACHGGTKPCGFSTPDQSIIRTSDDSLLMALYGHAADGFKGGSLYTTIYFTSTDGLTWTYASRIDVTPAMTKPGEGPCEPSLVRLKDGRVLTALRLEGGIPLWMAYSSDK